MDTNENQVTSSYSKEDYDRIQELCLMDDIFMSAVFGRDIQATQLLIQIILEREDISVISITGQDEIKNLMRHDVRLDVHAIDDNGVNYDIEIQRNDKGAVPQRARYNGDLMDMTMLQKGADYSELKESYVIFITENDYLKEGLPLYHVDRVVRETGKRFDDGSHIIYVNGKYRGNDSIGMLIHDLHCKHADEMHYAPIADGVRYYKDSEKGVESMCKIVEDAVEKRIRDAVINMWEKGHHDLNEIADIFSLTVDRVKWILGPARLSQAELIA